MGLCVGNSGEFGIMLCFILEEKIVVLNLMVVLVRYCLICLWLEFVGYGSIFLRSIYKGSDS